MKISELLQPHMTESAHVHTDNVRGWGAVPDNQNVDYLGMRVHMTPEQFLKLAAPLAPHEAESSTHILDHLKSGGKVGSPFLTIRIPESWEHEDFTHPAKVVNHEGRNRMMALQQIQGDAPVETHLFFSGGLRARHIQPEWISQMNKLLIPQKGTHAIPGTFFDRIMQEQSTRTSKSGAPGTLKAKIKRVYGDNSVTCTNTQKLKTRPSATAHDKAQANWFQNMQCGGATRVDEIFTEPALHVEWTPYGESSFVTRFPFEDQRVWIEMYQYQDNSEIEYEFGSQLPDSLPDQALGWNVIFRVGHATHVTGAWGAQSVKLLVKVIQLVRGFLEKHGWDYVMFVGESGSRNKLYAALAHRLAEQTHAHVIQQGDAFLVHKFDRAEDKVTEVIDATPNPMPWFSLGSGEDTVWETNFRFDNKQVVVELYPDIRQKAVQYVFNNVDLDLPVDYQGYEIIFRVDHTTNITGELGARAPALLSQVLSVLYGFLQTHDWDYVLFTGEPGSRDKLYASLSDRLARKLDAKWVEYNSDFVIYKTHMQEDAAGVGLVVPGVNMPAGQHPDEIRRQARKFGFKTTAQGVPPVSRTDGKF